MQSWQFWRFVCFRDSRSKQILTVIRHRGDCFRGGFNTQVIAVVFQSSIWVMIILSVELDMPFAFWAWLREWRCEKPYKDISRSKLYPRLKTLLYALLLDDSMKLHQKNYGPGDFQAIWPNRSCTPAKSRRKGVDLHSRNHFTHHECSTGGPWDMSTWKGDTISWGFRELPKKNFPENGEVGEILCMIWKVVWKSSFCIFIRNSWFHGFMWFEIHPTERNGCLRFKERYVEKFCAMLTWCVSCGMDLFWISRHFHLRGRGEQ